MNVGLLPTLDIMIASAKHGIRWAENGGARPNAGTIRQSRGRVPSYLPISRLPPGSDVVLICLRDEYADPIQDVLIVTWKTPDGQVAPQRAVLVLDAEMGASCTYRALGGAHGREVDQVGEVVP